LITLLIVLNFILALFLLITLTNISFGPFLRRRLNPQDYPQVSILIPARNEANSIEACLDSLLRQDYPNFEIIVLDDESTDRTLEIITRMAHDQPKVNFIKGDPLPEGWIGKNWACHQLSNMAKGEIYIFSDADNRYSKCAIRLTVARMQKYGLDMLSAFPQQLTITFMERLIVPVVDMVIYSSLVLWLTYYSKYSSLAAANGQWIAFLAKSYKKLGGHSKVRQNIVEDVELSRLAKRDGLKTMTCAGTEVIYGRMYQSAREVWQGYSKNLFGLLSSRTVLFFGILLGFILVFILPYFLLFSKALLPLALIAVFQNILLRIVLALRFKHPIISSTIFHPFSVFLFILIALNSFQKSTFGSHRWKDRTIVLRQSD
jgi:chlorobactene glucosyltransferase